MFHPLLLQNWVNCFHCHHVCDQLLMMNFYEMIFLHLYFFIHYFIIDTNTWLYISFFFKSNECINRTFVMYVDTRKVQISYYINTVWYILIIWFATINVWVNSSKYPPLRLGQNIPAMFSYWQIKWYIDFFIFKNSTLI